MEVNKGTIFWKALACLPRCLLSPCKFARRCVKRILAFPPSACFAVRPIEVRTDNSTTSQKQWRNKALEGRDRHEVGSIFPDEEFKFTFTRKSRNEEKFQLRYGASDATGTSDCRAILFEQEGTGNYPYKASRRLALLDFRWFNLLHVLQAKNPLIFERFTNSSA